MFLVHADELVDSDMYLIFLFLYFCFKHILNECMQMYATTSMSMLTLLARTSIPLLPSPIYSKTKDTSIHEFHLNNESMLRAKRHISYIRTCTIGLSEPYLECLLGRIFWINNLMQIVAIVAPTKHIIIVLHVVRMN